MTTETLLQLLIGGLLGLVGQGLRVIVGLKKMQDQASQTGTTVKDEFVTSTFFTSLLIGFVAGVLAMVSISSFKADFFEQNTKSTIMTLIAGGYAGTDFIEGFIKKYIPAGGNAANNANNTNNNNAAQR